MPSLPPELLAVIDDDLWREASDRLKCLLVNNLTDVVIESVDWQIDELLSLDPGFAIDNGEVYTAASSWARDHADQLLLPPRRGDRESQGNVLRTDQNLVAEAVGSWFETPGATLGDLSRQLQRGLDENEYRARMIASTEVTRAASAGRSFARQGVGMPETAFKPPFHPNCRCGDIARRGPEGQWHIIWETQQDEFVCKAPQVGPGGRVIEGCSGMHHRIISAGEHFGEKWKDVFG